MSWKSLVTAGLLCVLASPAFAVPNLGLVSTQGTKASGHLDAAGNWIWTVQVTPDVSAGYVGDGTGTPVAAELGFTSNKDIKTASQTAAELVNFDKLNPGSAIYGSTWQTAGNGLIDANSNNRPTGIQLSAPGIGTNAGASYTANSSFASNANQVFAALGSVNFTTAGPKDMLNITVARPVESTGVTPTTTTITVGGVYGTGSSNGRLTQINGVTGGVYSSTSTDTFSGPTYSFTMRAKGGDADLNGVDNFADYSAVTGNYLVAGTFGWAEGDFDGNGVVNFADYSLVTANYLVAGFNYSVGPSSPGAGSGGGLGSSNVPEPASIALLGLALIGGLGTIRRKR